MLLVVGAAHTAVVLVSERTWPRPQGAVRSASLRARSVRTLAPAGTRLLLAAGAAGVLGVSSVVWATLHGATVSRAHRELKAQGSVVSRRRTGTFVADAAAGPGGDRADTDSRVLAAVAAAVEEARRAGWGEAALLTAVRGAMLTTGAPQSRVTHPPDVPEEHPAPRRGRFDGCRGALCGADGPAGGPGGIRWW